MNNPNCIANCTKELIENNLCDCYNRGIHPLNKPKEKMESNFVTSGKAAWYVAVIFVILAILFSGCENINVSENITVKDIHRVNSTICIIDIYGNSSPDNFGDRTKISFSFKDTCSEYVIGDTLFLKYVNKSN